MYLVGGSHYGSSVTELLDAEEVVVNDLPYDGRRRQPPPLGRLLSTADVVATGQPALADRGLSPPAPDAALVAGSTSGLLGPIADLEDWESTSSPGPTTAKYFRGVRDEDPREPREAVTWQSSCTCASLRRGCAGGPFDHVGHDVWVADGEAVRSVHLGDVEVGGFAVHFVLRPALLGTYLRYGRGPGLVVCMKEGNREVR